jgi:hypothetical protein
MRFWVRIVTLVTALVAASPAAHAALWSKTYQFKTGVTLEVGADTGDGLRLDGVRFDMPSNAGARTAREAVVEVTIANASADSRRVGLAVALFDGAGRLVGVADGGTSLVPLRAGTLRAYRMVFRNVNVDAANAETFQISVEGKP